MQERGHVLRNGFHVAASSCSPVWYNEKVMEQRVMFRIPVIWRMTLLTAMVLLLVWLPLPQPMPIIGAFALTCLLPGYLFQRLFHTSPFTEPIDRFIHAVLISIILPFLILFAFFYVIAFSPTIFRPFLSGIIVFLFSASLVTQQKQGRQPPTSE